MNIFLHDGLICAVMIIGVLLGGLIAYVLWKFILVKIVDSIMDSKRERLTEEQRKQMKVMENYVVNRILREIEEDIISKNIFYNEKEE